MSEPVNEPSSRSEGEEHLLLVLQQVNEWLRFAETKNAGMAALLGVTATALLTFLNGLASYPCPIVILFSISGAFLLVGLVTTVITFIPILSNPFHPSPIKEDESEDNINLYFYDHLARYEADALLSALELPKTTKSPNRRSRYERNLAQQVINNSRITRLKMNFFRVAAGGWMLGVLVGVAGIIVALREGLNHVAK